jgi:hypothetical protein
MIKLSMQVFIRKKAFDEMEEGTATINKNYCSPIQCDLNVDF